MKFINKCTNQDKYFVQLAMTMVAEFVCDTLAWTNKQTDRYAY